MHPELRGKIEAAARILRDAGATHVYVFGSAGDEREMLPGREPRDIDLAVEGLPPDQLLRVMAQLFDTLRFPIDLIDLDRPTTLVRRLKERGRLKRVA